MEVQSAVINNEYIKKYFHQPQYNPLYHSHLNRVLNIRVDVYARLHAGVGALAQHLARQTVQVCGGREVGLVGVGSELILIPFVCNYPTAEF